TLRALNKEDPKAFETGSSLLFDVEQRNILNTIVRKPLIERPKLQRQLNSAVEELASIMSKQLSESGRAFLNDRNISDEQISEYNIGDNGVLESHFREIFDHLSHRHTDEVLGMLQTCLSQYRSAIVDRYGSPHFISFPAYRNNQLTGIVFRTVAFEKREDQVRNMFKFYSPYNYSYLFNEDALDTFDEINVVEGVADAMALIRYGYKNTVSPSMVRLSPAHIQKLSNKKLNILFDQDMGGFAGAKYIMDRIPTEQLKVVALTPNERDFDEEDEAVIHSYMANLAEYDIRKHT
ncbi:MAG: toprim domain-containing protein, partial [Actinobacteria bacterium]|nr:toprim domain-containing protein [Actinomycetota bacterium]